MRSDTKTLSDYYQIELMSFMWPKYDCGGIRIHDNMKHIIAKTVPDMFEN